jgi:hypothetical protein
MKIKTLCLLLIILVVTAVPIIAQDKDGFTTKIYQIKNHKVVDIARLLLGMDGPELELVPGSLNEALNTFSVRARPNGHEKVSEIIGKFDVPAKSIEFQFFLIKATSAGEGLKARLPAQAERALRDFAQFSRSYTGFELIGNPGILTKEGALSAALKGNGLYSYEINISNISISAQENKNRINAGNFWIRFSIPTQHIDTQGKAVSREVLLNTPFSLVEGEVIILGASQIEQSKDSGAAIIAIVMARIV